MILNHVVQGFDYSLVYERAYRNGNELLIIFKAHSDKGIQWGTIDLAKLNWELEAETQQAAIQHAITTEESKPPNTETAAYERLKLSETDVEGKRETTIHIPKGQSISVPYTLTLSRDPQNTAILVLRARSTDGANTLVSKVQPRNEGTPWLAVLYPATVALDAAGLPFAFLLQIFLGH